MKNCFRITFGVIGTVLRKNQGVVVPEITREVSDLFTAVHADGFKERFLLREFFHALSRSLLACFENPFVFQEIVEVATDMRIGFVHIRK